MRLSLTLSAISIMVTFGLPLSSLVHLYLCFTIGVSVNGVLASFAFYLPELFSTRLRATGSGFCYNVGRIVAAAGPFLVGTIASQGSNSLNAALSVLFWVGFIPLVGLACLPWVIETKGRVLV